MDTTAIATLMNSSPEEVAAAINAVEKWKANNSAEMVVASMNEQALVAMEPVGRTLAQAQEARKLIAPAVVHPLTGEVLREAEYAPDYTTQIAATEAVARIVESVQAKGPGVQVNVGGQHVHANGGGRSFEERLRLQREKRGIREAEMDAVTIDGNASEVMVDGSADDDGGEEELEEELDEDLEDESELEDDGTEEEA